ncbi:hypothetical protein K466DRAFT_607349 [Polyporus arcularius HHB13444]|uniref:DNase I-like protein n=1 Tax=Polyporus arcularius HHB13444 TaxID=1314778 RepID=A0A5C3NQ33_9APHY|nr:hypothetical protein K466DRAFT_607349 [Polyporus arcularius HHB13444]
MVVSQSTIPTANTPPFSSTYESETRTAYGPQRSAEDRGRDAGGAQPPPGDVLDGNGSTVRGDEEEHSQPAVPNTQDTRRRREKKARKLRKTAIKIASLNINGYGNLVRDHEDNKWGKLYRMMSDNRVAVLLLQETHLTNERMAAIHSMFAHKIRVFNSENRDAPTQREGVAIVLNARYVNPKDAAVIEIVPGKALQMSLTCQGGDVKTILCIYAPTSQGAAERKLFFEEVRNYYTNHPGVPRPDLMGGDFNTTN